MGKKRYKYAALQVRKWIRTDCLGVQPLHVYVYVYMCIGTYAWCNVYMCIGTYVWCKSMNKNKEGLFVVDYIDVIHDNHHHHHHQQQHPPPSSSYICIHVYMYTCIYVYTYLYIYTSHVTYFMTTTTPHTFQDIPCLQQD